MSSFKTAAARKAAGAPRARKPSAPPRRKLAANALTSSPASAAESDIGPRMAVLATEIEKAVRADGADSLPVEQLQHLIAATVKAYSAKRAAGEQFHPVSRAGRLTPTDIMVAANGLLRSGNLQIFELGMWQSWTGD